MKLIPALAGERPLTDWLPWQQRKVYFQFMKFKFCYYVFGKVTKFQGNGLSRFGALSHLLGWTWKATPLV